MNARGRIFTLALSTVTALSLLATASLAVTASTPSAGEEAGAGGFITPRQPDGLITIGTAPYIGGDIYNADGTGQTMAKTGQIGSKFTFKIQIENDGISTERFTVHATGDEVAGYTVKYKKRNNTITSEVVNGTYVTGKVAPGSHITIKCTVKLAPGTAHGSEVTRLITITSINNAAQLDAVKVIVNRN